MALQFPNATRTYDPNGPCIRFVGYDGLVQVFFSIAVTVLTSERKNAAGYLREFDTSLERVRGIATKAYSKTRKNNYRLSKADL